MALSKKDLCSRRIFDWQVVSRMSEPPTYLFTAHKTARDATTGENPILTEDQARFALHYRAVYRIRTLIGENLYSKCTIIRIDAAAAGYPHAAPSVWILDDEESRTPWSPHFAQGIPVCIGTGWTGDGQTLMGHLLIHLARLLNWDEKLADGYSGYNGKAIRWWRENLNRPIDPGLQYPRLPEDLLYGANAARNAGGFRPAGTTTGDGGGFRPVGGTIQGGGGFRPAGVTTQGGGGFRAATARIKR